eukprot:1790224-Prorocentrum_lima.AAC.1
MSSSAVAPALLVFSMTRTKGARSLGSWGSRGGYLRASVISSVSSSAIRSPRVSCGNVSSCGVWNVPSCGVSNVPKLS